MAGPVASQKRAISVCSALRCVLFRAPMTLISLKSRAQRSLCQRGRRPGAKLVGARHHPGFAQRPLGCGRNDGGHIAPRRRQRPVAFRRGGAIVGAPREHGDRRLPAHVQPGGFSLAVGDGCQRRLIGAVDGGLLRGHQLRQRGMVGLRDRRVDRGAGIGGLQLPLRIAPGNGVDGLVYRSLHDRHRPIRRMGRELGGGHDIAGLFIPVGDHIGLRRERGKPYCGGHHQGRPGMCADVSHDLSPSQ
jgi:hypothetical protein